MFRRMGGGAGRDRRRGAGVALAVASAAVAIAVWWAVAAAGIWSELVFPGPDAVWAAFVHSVRTEDGRRGFFDAYLWEHAWASVWRVVQGVFRAVVVGVPL